MIAAIWSTRKRKMAHPTKTTNKKAIFGFCSFTTSAKNVETSAIPTI
jgi:hypothetical protein